MRAFYDKIRETEMAQSPAEAFGLLMEAYLMGVTLIERARSRCEFGTVEYISRSLQWTACCCSEKHAGGDFPPWELWPGSSFGCFAAYAPKRCSSSLDFRWRERADEAETWLPSVPLWTRGPQLEA
jgi:hypothetical protein